MIEQEPKRYLFSPVYFGKLALLDKATGLMHADSTNREISVPLYKFNPSKYLQEQMGMTSEQVNAVVTLNFELRSSEISNLNHVNRVIDNAR